jgi:putative transposon-encoded protein
MKQASPHFLSFLFLEKIFALFKKTICQKGASTKMLIPPKEVRVWFYSIICTFSIHTNNLIHSYQLSLGHWLMEETKI